MSININIYYTDSLKDLLPKRRIIHYLDFNVANYLYKNKCTDADLSNFIFYPDSTAVFAYLKLLNRNIKKQNSTDMLFALLKYLDKNKQTVFFFGDKEDILIKVKEAIKRNYPEIVVKGFNQGFTYNDNEVINKINQSMADVLFIGLGVGRQEKWLIDNSDKLNVKNIICVGGWFQYLSNAKKRAPLLMRRTHLEWLFKLINEFSRVWKRYIFGIPLFYWRLFTKQIQLDLKK